VIQRDLALHIGRSTAFNCRQLQMLTIAFRAAALLLVTEVVAWMVALLTKTQTDRLRYISEKPTPLFSPA
jgi:hypothetical protein